MLSVMSFMSSKLYKSYDILAVQILYWLL